jgi:hypothetical protein
VARSSSHETALVLNRLFLMTHVNEVVMSNDDYDFTTADVLRRIKDNPWKSPKSPHDRACNAIIRRIKMKRFKDEIVFLLAIIGAFYVACAVYDAIL